MCLCEVHPLTNGLGIVRSFVSKLSGVYNKNARANLESLLWPLIDANEPENVYHINNMIFKKDSGIPLIGGKEK